MRLFIRHIVIFLLFSTGLSAQQLRMDALEKSFGTMRPLERRTLTFTVYNDGPVTAHLGQPRPSCGCTATMLSNSTLAPGDSAVVEVRFHAAPGMMGQIAKSVSMDLHEESGTTTFAVLRIRGSVVGDVIYSPGMLRFTAVVGDTVRLQLTLSSNTDKPVRLQSLSASLLAYVDTTAGNRYHIDQVQSRPFTAFDLHLEAEQLMPDDSTRLYMQLRPTEKGQINGTIRVPIPDGELRIPVSGVVLRTRAP
ncbi:MAG: hypothetical protein C0600_06865 [Ignavibacteria bacterium]|nr:MAG: hypothetical protein C0600_06865 [Ignavibacteria bacterium]